MMNKSTLLTSVVVSSLLGTGLYGEKSFSMNKKKKKKNKNKTQKKSRRKNR